MYCTPRPYFIFEDFVYFLKKIKQLWTTWVSCKRLAPQIVRLIPKKAQSSNEKREAKINYLIQSFINPLSPPSDLKEHLFQSFPLFIFFRNNDISSFHSISICSTLAQIYLRQKRAWKVFEMFRILRFPSYRPVFIWVGLLIVGLQCESC